MARAVTLFTGQWADLMLEAIAQKTTDWGYDGLELACRGTALRLASRWKKINTERNVGYNS